MLLANILRQRGVFPVMHDPVLRPDAEIPDRPAVYFISTRWTEYKNFAFKPGDTVIDPWRMISGVPEGVEYVPVGKPSAAQAIEVKTMAPVAAG